MKHIVKEWVVCMCCVCVYKLCVYFVPHAWIVQNIDSILSILCLFSIHPMLEVGDPNAILGVIKVLGGNTAS